MLMARAGYSVELSSYPGRGLWRCCRRWYVSGFGRCAAKLGLVGSRWLNVANPASRATIDSPQHKSAAYEPAMSQHGPAGSVTSDVYERRQPDLSPGDHGDGYVQQPSLRSNLDLPPASPSIAFEASIASGALSFTTNTVCRSSSSGPRTTRQPRRKANEPSCTTISIARIYAALAVTCE